MLVLYLFGRLSLRNISGIVLLDTRPIIVVPVIAADGGAANKICKGSTALLKALSSDGKLHTIASVVTFVLFPRTSKKLTVNSIGQRVHFKGSELYKQLAGES